jgi:hypothetical protein
MKLSPEEAITQIDAVLKSISTRAAFNVGELELPQRIAFVAAGASAIGRLTPTGSPFQRIADQAIREPYSTGVSDIHGALQALRADYEGGYAASIEELVHADLFGDFIAMAQELLDKGYRDAAAVIVGSVLEGHLRQLCAKHGVDPDDDAGRPKKSDRMNADLKKAGAYGNLEQKEVTNWLGLRNHAAHGEYDRYDEAQVALMLQGVTGFLARLPA